MCNALRSSVKQNFVKKQFIFRRNKICVKWIPYWMKDTCKSVLPKNYIKTKLNIMPITYDTSTFTGNSKFNFYLSKFVRLLSGLHTECWDIENQYNLVVKRHWTQTCGLFCSFVFENWHSSVLEFQRRINFPKFLRFTFEHINRYPSIGRTNDGHRIILKYKEIQWVFNWYLLCRFNSEIIT